MYEKQVELEKKDRQKLEEKRQKSINEFEWSKIFLLQLSIIISRKLFIFISDKQYGDDLKKIIINNRIEYAMKLLKRQQNIHDECAKKP